MAEVVLRARRDYRDLGDEDWALFNAALADMKSRGDYDQYGESHDALDGDGIHGQFFLPWHRDFLNNFEIALRNNDQYDVAIPYWNWEEEPRVPIQLNALRSDWGLAPSEADQISGLSNNRERRQTEWREFNNMMYFGSHGTVHIEIGGVMGTMRSPLDPFFWMHHGNLDKIWHDWQQGANGADPDNLDITMPRSPTTQTKVGNTVDVNAMGFSYIPFGG